MLSRNPRGTARAAAAVANELRSGGQWSSSSFTRHKTADWPHVTAAFLALKALAVGRTVADVGMPYHTDPGVAGVSELYAGFDHGKRYEHIEAGLRVVDPEPVLAAAVRLIRDHTDDACTTLQRAKDAGQFVL